MSLDVYLQGDERKTVCRCPCCEHEHKRMVATEFFSANITHNLGPMARAARIYKPLWRPEELGITKAAQLIEPLKKGLQLLKSNPERFEKLNSPNGWGLYENFVPWVEAYLCACELHPDAHVKVWR